MEEELKEYFVKRMALPLEILEEMESEKINIETIMGMTIDELKKYIPTCGDRIALINFCRSRAGSKASQNRTLTLLEKLKRDQRNLMEDDEIYSQKKKLKINSHPGRKPQTTRKIQLGWILNGTPVRLKKGGGNREISVNKSHKKADILKIASDLFFPKGSSTYGKLDDFNCDLLDFQQSEISDHLTVGEIYDITKLNILRFYLSTHEKEKVKIKTNTVLKDKMNTHSSICKSKPNIDNENNIVSFFSKWNNNDGDQVNTDENNLYDYILDFNGTLITTPNEIIEENSIVFTNATEEISAHNLIEESSSVISKTLNLRLHRGRIFEELLAAFQNNINDTDLITIEMVLPNGETENGDDLGGIFRDALSEFWESFYERCTLGTKSKVPYIRHDFGDDHWKAIARILMYGYNREGYFPIKLSRTFIEHCLGQIIDDNSLIEDFKHFVSEADSDIITESLIHFSEDNEDILNFVSNYDSKWIPRSENIKKLLRDISHKELIQKPAFVAKCFAQEFQGNRRFNVITIRNLYNRLKPSAKNCISKLQLQEEEITAKKTEIFGYLKKFINEGDDRLRSLFLRFCTGSDLPIKDITISFFVSESDFTRTPIGHTCAGLLELPLSYENYLDFRNELKNILSSNIWIMDIM